MSQLYKTIFGRRLNKTMTLGEAISLLESKDLIAVGEVAELAVSMKSGVERCSKNYPGIDLVSDKQIKHARTNPENPVHGGKLRAYISVKNTTSTILAVVTERLTGKEYYFELPYSCYRHHNGSTIGIPFHANGTPVLTNKWWKYQVDSLDELCEMAK